MTATIDEVRQDLEDLAAWRSGLSDAVDTILGVSSPRLSTDGRGTSNGLALPFHLDRAVDEPDLGGAGVRTEAGLLDLLGSWARSIAHDRGETAKGSPLTYLHTTLQWAQEHADWDGLAGDIHDAWVAVGRIVGHAPQTVGPCLVPHCHGTVRADMRDANGHGDGGRHDYAWCDTCGAMYYSDPEVYHEEAVHVIERDRDQLRSVAIDATRAVTTEQALTIWPELDRRTIWDWRDAGRLPTKRGKHNLRALNQLANVLVEKRTRRNKRDPAA